MKMRAWSAAILGLAFLGGAAAAAPAPEKPKGQMQFTGAWVAQNVNPSSDGTVNLDFSATIDNLGPKDVTGELLLRDYADNKKVWGRFGKQTIEAGGSVTVSGNVTVPKTVFKTWTGGGGPSVFIYAENARGDVTMVNIPLVEGEAVPTGK
jgi:hypothetical protein